MQIPKRLASEGNQGKYMADEGLKVSYPRKGISYSFLEQCLVLERHFEMEMYQLNGTENV